MRQTVSKEIKDRKGYICYNCGSREDIEYHHIVPLFLGGNDVETNIVPLCHKCHKAAHCGRHMSHYVDSSNSGRKPKATAEKDSKVFDMFINGEIGNKKCCELLGYSSRTPIKSRSSFKEYLHSKGISSIKNMVDFVATTRSGGLCEGVNVGEIEYANGNRAPIIYKDTGANDVEYKPRKIGDVDKALETKPKRKYRKKILKEIDSHPLDFYDSYEPVIRESINGMKVTMNF
ncbi:HNH endonuclease [Bacteroides acidifaciens]|uniref:HNH endonuclease n=1 Tax=Bacteroides acidifaciens TaxID=85831 RepID=UPI00248C0DAC|nr:HNH endonuclease [Bacteroides acidifaciens]